MSASEPALDRCGSSDVETVTVELAAGAYDVHVGAGVRHRLASVIPAGARRAAIITQAGIDWQVESGLEQSVFTVADGERAKSLSEVERLCGRLSTAGFTRADVIVALGGGVVSDLAGFTAAVYHRGVRYVTVATTLLAQVDAAVGGKTGVNLTEGKNLVGAFWQPHAVLCDTETLASLGPRELRSGQGEMAKYHFLTGEDLDALDTVARIAAAVRIKAEVVAADEREGGRRVILNYGHTLAHAIETAGRYDMRHGEAVAVGLVYAAEVALRMGRIDERRVAAHRRVVAGYGLPDRLPELLSDDELLESFSRDKKALDGVTFVLDSERGVEPVVGVPESVQRDALQAIK
ncbi:MAG: 3-dehydroquinate synthase [Acidimicrobiaceae bacterium]|nr:3-dehydroquinate synthase [Acidimicrobiaceae bacterium]